MYKQWINNVPPNFCPKYPFAAGKRGRGPDVWWLSILTTPFPFLGSVREEGNDHNEQKDFAFADFFPLLSARLKSLLPDSKKNWKRSNIDIYPLVCLVGMLRPTFNLPRLYFRALPKNKETMAESAMRWRFLSVKDSLSCCDTSTG